MANNAKRKGGKFAVNPNSARQRKKAAKKAPARKVPSVAPTAPPVFTDPPPVNAVDSTAPDAVPEATDGAPVTDPPTVEEAPQAVDPDGDDLGYFPDNVGPTDDQVPQPTDDSPADTEEAKAKRPKDVKGQVFMDPKEAGEMIAGLVASTWVAYITMRHPYVLQLKPEQMVKFAMTQEEVDRIEKAGRLYAKHKPIPISPEGNLFVVIAMAMVPKIMDAEKMRKEVRKRGVPT